MSSDLDLIPSARRAWASLEVLHVLGYFAPEVTEEYVAWGCILACPTSPPAPPRWDRSVPS